MNMKISTLNTSLATVPSVVTSWVMDAPLTFLFAYIVHCKLKWSPTTFIKQDDEQYAQGKELRGSFSSKSS